MKGKSVNPFLAKAFFVCMIISIMWSPEMSLTFFDITGTQFFILKSVDRLLSVLIICIAILWLIDTMYEIATGYKPVNNNSRPIVIQQANLMLDSETLKPYEDHIINAIKAYTVATGPISIRVDDEAAPGKGKEA